MPVWTTHQVQWDTGSSSCRETDKFLFLQKKKYSIPFLRGEQGKKVGMFDKIPGDYGIIEAIGK